MINDIISIVDPDDRPKLTKFTMLALLYAMAESVAVLMLVPLASALASGRWDDVVRTLGILAAVGLVAVTINYFSALTSYGLALNSIFYLHRRLGHQVAKLPLGWFGKERAGLLAELTKSLMTISSLFAHLMGPVIVGCGVIFTMIVGFLIIDWRLGLTMLVCAPLILVGAWFAQWLHTRPAKRLTTTQIEVNDRILEFAQAQPALRAFGRSTDYRPLTDALAKQKKAGYAMLGFGFISEGLHFFVVQTVFSALVLVGAWLATYGNVGPLEAIALIAVSARFVQPLEEFGGYLVGMRPTMNSIKQLNKVLTVEPLPDTEIAVPSTAPGTVELRDVSFGYGKDLVLSRVSLQVPAASMTALVGPSGSGKTTITRLIARFWDANSGTVTVGGVDVRDQSVSALMAQLSLVFQDVYLFDDTLRANVLVGRDGATDAELAEVAALSGVDEIVARLPHGWDSEVGEGGTALSGGERQRVSIARALLKGAPIVLFDEATSALDPQNTRNIAAAMSKLRETSTVIVIAHNLTTVQAADQIVVLDEFGRVAQCGKHSELIAQTGLYQQFWNERSRAQGWRLASTASTAQGESL